MKKFNYFLLLLVSVLTVSACTSEVDNLFPDSSSERSAKDIARLKKILMDAPNGWCIEYYGNLTYGGYNVLCKFDNDHVKFAAEKAGKNHSAGIDEHGNLVGTEQLTTYTIVQSMGTVLSINGGNKLFNYFSMPNNPDYGEPRDGFGGDFEFRVLSASPEKIELTGRKHGRKIVMRPIPADVTWVDYLKTIKETDDYMASFSYRLRGEGIPDSVEIFVSQYYRSLLFKYVDEKKEYHAELLPFIVTKDGFKVYSQINVRGINVGDFAKGDSDERFYLADNKNVWLEAVILPLWETFKRGRWYFSYSQVGDYQKPLWDDFREALKTAGDGNKEEDLFDASIGTIENIKPDGSKEVKTGFHFTTTSSYGFVDLQFLKPNAEGDEISIKFSETAPTNTVAIDYLRDHKLLPVIKSFAGKGVFSKLPRFKITTDNKRKPSQLTFTDTKNPNNVFTLSVNRIFKPLDN